MSEAGLPSRLKSFLASRPCLSPNFSANSIIFEVLSNGMIFFWLGVFAYFLIKICTNWSFIAAVDEEVLE